MGALLVKVTISDIDVSAYLLRGTLLDRTFKEAAGRTDLEFAYKITDVITPTVGNKLEIWKGYVTSTDTKIFSGWIEDKDDDIGTYKIMGFDKLASLVHRSVNYSYDSNIDASAGKISEIIKDLIETWGGETAEVQDSGTSITIDKFRCLDADVLERCQRLTEVLDWQLYYDATDNKIHFEEKGYELNTHILEVGGSNVLGIPKWKNEGKDIITDLTVRGTTTKIETTEYFTGDGTETSFTLSQTPFSVKVYRLITAVYVLQTGGKDRSTAGSYDYTVDTERKKIVFESGSVPPAGADTVMVYLTYEIPTPIVVVDTSARTLYQRRDKTIYLNDVETVDDAEQIARGKIAIFKQPFQGTEILSHNVTDLNVGQRIPVIDNQAGHSVNDLFVINRHIINYPSAFEKVELGDKGYIVGQWEESVTERIKRLEEEAGRNSDMLVNLKVFSNSIRLKYRNKKIKKRNVGSTFILAGTEGGITPNSRLGTSGGHLAPATDLGETLTQFVKVSDPYYLDFAGVDDDYVVIGDDTAFDTTTLSLSIWVKGGTQLTGQNIYIFSKWSEWAIRVSNTSNVHNLSFYIAGVATYLSGVDVLDDTWHHVVITQKTTSLIFYVDGVSVITGYSGAVVLDTGDIFIGSYSATYGNFTGQLKDARIYDVVLTALEVEKIYNSGLGEYCIDAENNLIGAWRLDEGYGSTVFDVSTDNDGTITGADWTEDTGEVATTWRNDTCVSCDGDNDYIIVPRSSSLEPDYISLSVWVYYTTDPTGENRHIINKRWNTGSPWRSYDLYYTDSSHKFIFLVWDGTNFKWITHQATVTTGVWFHIVGTWDGTNIKIYVNNVDSTDSPLGSMTGAIAYTTTGDSELFFASFDTTPEWPIILTDVRIYDTALSVTEIGQLYNSGSGTFNYVKQSSLVGRWAFNEGQGTALYDMTKNHNNGTLTNNPRWIKSTKAIEGG